jgi:hypothetical protein
MAGETTSTTNIELVVNASSATILVTDPGISLISYYHIASCVVTTPAEVTVATTLI